MSKLVASATAAVGGTATAVGGSYLLQHGTGANVKTATGTKTDQGGDSGDQASTTTKHPQTSQDTSKKLEFEDVATFKANMQNSSCVKDYFKEAIEDGTTGTNTNPPADGTFFKTPPTTTDPYKSCLTINWKTTKYGSEDKWSGKFTWLWAFVRGDEGFITFNVAESSDKEDGKLKFTGIFYLVGKKPNEDNKWEVKYKKEVSDDKEVSITTDLDNYFPKASDALKTNGGGEYWGFLESADKLAKACKKESCGSGGTEGEPVKKQLSWANTTSGGTSIKDWSKDFNWWNSLYQLTSWSFGDKLSGFSGNWSVSS